VGLATPALAGVWCRFWGHHCGDSGAGAGKDSAPASGAAGPVGGPRLCLASQSLLLWLHPLDLGGDPFWPLSLPVCLALWLGCGLAGGHSFGGASGRWLCVWLGPRRWSTLCCGSDLGLAEVPGYRARPPGSDRPGNHPPAGRCRALAAGGPSWGRLGGCGPSS